MFNSMDSGKSGGKKYAAPEAVRLGGVSSGQGADCSGTGSAALSACAATGSLAQACTTGNVTGGNGECITGNNARNCPAGNAAYSYPPGCHTGTGPATEKS